MVLLFHRTSYISLTISDSWQTNPTKHRAVTNKNLYYVKLFLILLLPSFIMTLSKLKYIRSFPGRNLEKLIQSYSFRLILICLIISLLPLGVGSNHCLPVCLPLIGINHRVCRSIVNVQYIDHLPHPKKQLHSDSQFI